MLGFAGGGFAGAVGFFEVLDVEFAQELFDLRAGVEDLRRRHGGGGLDGGRDVPLVVDAEELAGEAAGGFEAGDDPTPECGEVVGVAEGEGERGIDEVRVLELSSCVGVGDE